MGNIQHFLQRMERQNVFNTTFVTVSVTNMKTKIMIWGGGVKVNE